MLNNKIIKYYLDIGCIYKGEEDIDNVYYDHQNWNIKDYGLIGILKLEIDIKNRTKKEVFFKQIFKPDVCEFARSLISDFTCTKKDVLVGHPFYGTNREYNDADLIVGWNSRDFDIPVIMNNIGCSETYKARSLKIIDKKDRDLLDLCILRDIPIKGGLEAVVKRLRIKHNLRCKSCPEYTEEEECFYTDFDTVTNVCNNNLKMIKQRNEFDIRILPLLEERLGYIYEPRMIQDKFHKNWRNNYRNNLDIAIK